MKQGIMWCGWSNNGQQRLEEQNEQTNRPCNSWFSQQTNEDYCLRLGLSGEDSMGSGRKNEVKLKYIILRWAI